MLLSSVSSAASTTHATWLVAVSFCRFKCPRCIFHQTFPLGHLSILPHSYFLWGRRTPASSSFLCEAIAGWSFLFCCNMRLDCGGGGRGQQGLGNGTEHCVSELAEVLWAYQLVPCARAKGKFVFSCPKLRILSAVTGLGAKGLGVTSVKVTSASCLTREGLHGCCLYVCGGVASHWACPDS